MSLTYFPVTGTLKAIVSDSSADEDGNADVENISCFVYFKPSVSQVFSTVDQTLYRLETIRARTEIGNGLLKTIDGNTVGLVANSAALGLGELIYTVSFDHVVIDGKKDMVIDSFKFVAPTDTTAIDLATVPRV